ncbi:hypothetical protein H8356DRAFT_1691533 [Neocallimastix lanati (nom. inval.)]|jgi:hypothetical protein|uniref:Uncharacterized protein n=1 Tax=Neocallimastix californiae TaxID=1754190 RepID=A0A1Y2AQH6_9FUNG|nr:hypothetical protein H8356DRAFT_1691533 [Neocallimastix sp. JGI-2020a]ORY24813.1 hypothetical protein LY90DRAFT_675048 [Neocallimastix californiae]|eukprot:ORY24813.1 hypothetical protein LY90DRAFT_675048 [Neocallimastix californiae]
MKSQNSILYRIILFFILLNLISGKSIFENSKFTPASNITLSSIKNVEIKTSCQSISDCSEGALECRKDNNGNNSICIYPEYICSNAETCYLLDKSIDKTIFDNTTPVSCTSNDECISNQCTSGQCQVNLNSPNVLCTVDNSKYQCNKLTGEEKVSNKTSEKQEEKNDDSSSSNITLYIIIGIGIIVGAVIIGIVIRVCYESAQYLEEDPDIKEFRKENKLKLGDSVVISTLALA